METRQIVVREIPADLWKAFKIRAVSEGRTLQELIAAAIQDYLDRAA